MTVLKEGAAWAQLGGMLGLTTALFMAMMIGWLMWVYAPSRRLMMEEASRMPLDDLER